MTTAAEALSRDGPFARLLPGYAVRTQQQEMASAVEQALAQEGLLVAEAGTGTGKTFAYLVPALLSGKRVIISTGTRNLQDQLFHKDVPLVRKALAVPVDVALLKGRANYLCLHRMELAQSEGRFLSRSQLAELQQVKKWATQTHSGDIAELHDLSEESPLWSQITSTADNCLGNECDYLERCHLAHARRRAQEADVLVVNHHLLFADMALKDEGFGELLPGANAFIIDEAHQLPDTASNFFGTTISANQLLELARDTIAEDLKEAGESRQLRLFAEKLEKAVRDMRLVFDVNPTRGSWRDLSGRETVQAASDEVTACLASLFGCLKPLAVRGKGLEACFERAELLQQRFTLLTGPTPEGFIHWFETHTRSFSLNLTPMDVATLFRAQLDAHPASWVFTSATLAVGESFDHFTHQLGLERATTARWESPFDYPHQALLYVPENMPEPNSPGYTEAVVEQALPVIEASGGRTFLLFTSHRALKQAAELIRERIGYPLLVQGEAPRTVLLDRFRELGNAVLLGTGSFWEGVDVRGEALSCVIIDKLPFASPGDPVLQARIEAMRRAGGNPFMEYQLPQAVITLKQGVGRLIRDVNDRGVLMLCDPRLGSKGYGRVFIDSLPPMSKTRKFAVVERFYRHVTPVAV
ncbi:MAG: ATP-dependent DNA helicase [Gammaproteobacteria bacterium]|nr:ATP-dependent DNA helicase [Gammaproteobacteria bacterium]MCW8972276.1 ATP-dependent DNA helicase [Gammaproteobacteria bacterium]MCW8991871.1 ATP-dependent DNA helicase [Gammaproteobacteria bacterium]